jgi:hypothetical protein
MFGKQWSEEMSNGGGRRNRIEGRDHAESGAETYCQVLRALILERGGQRSGGRTQASPGF